MKNYTIYNKDNGKIDGVISTDDIINLKNLTYIEGIYDGNNTYVINNEIIERPILNNIININKNKFISNGIDEISIILPLKFIVNINNIDDINNISFNAEIDDGILTFTSTKKGSLEINIECFPYKPYKTIVECI